MTDKGHRLYQEWHDRRAPVRKMHVEIVGPNVHRIPPGTRVLLIRVKVNGTAEIEAKQKVDGVERSRYGVIDPGSWRWWKQ